MLKKRKTSPNEEEQEKKKTTTTPKRLKKMTLEGLQSLSPNELIRLAIQAFFTEGSRAKASRTGRSVTGFSKTPRRPCGVC
jgi:hypothetical protein